MKSLGTTLRKAIDQSGYSIYKVANKSGVNRTTLQKILSDDRPISFKMLNQLLAVLKLSPTEESDILSAFEISQSGETLYTLRLLIKEFLGNLFDTDSYFLLHQNPVPMITEGAFASALNYTGLASGNYQIEYLLEHLILRECQKENPILRLNLPGASPLIQHVCSRCLSYAQKQDGIKIRHITHFLCSNDSEKDSLANLETLSGILPFSALASFHYQIYYFYDNQPSMETSDLAFPYYILFSDTLILLSADGNVALPCTDDATLRYFHFLFEGTLKKAQPLVEPYNTAEELLNFLLKIDSEVTSFSSIEYQPCLITFLPDEFFYRYARSNELINDTLIQAAIDRSRQLAAIKDKCCIFSLAGLQDFAATGMLSDLPSAYVYPLSVQDRIQVLYSFYQYLENEKLYFRIANPATFPLPSRLSCIIRENIGVDFCVFNPEQSGFKHLHVQEHTILDAFEDFIQYVTQTSLVYSQEETKNAVLECIHQLEHQESYT